MSDEIVEQAKEDPKPVHELAEGNALKAISKTEDELRVANYIILYGGRDLEGIVTQKVNGDGTRGEYFTEATDLESEATKDGQFPVDWHHGRDPAPDAPGREDVLGRVDWASAVKDKVGIWVERILDRRNQYVKYLEPLIEKGLIGNSTESIPREVQKAANGEITRWPLVRDALTVTPIESRMLTQNTLTALKALGVVPLERGETDVEPPDSQLIAIAKAKAQLRNLELAG